MKNFIEKFLHIQKVYAHCDVPCGIYDPSPALIAANTVLKMVQKMEELKGSEESIVKTNNLTRMINTKEEHARKCKEEILILWTDFFKPEDAQAYPNLHELIWSTAKLISKNKQEVNMEAAKELVEKVNEIATLFKTVNEKRNLAK